MNNYYETCLLTLNDLIERGKELEALDLVSKELSLPYVPEPYFTQFSRLRDSIVIDSRPSSQFFEHQDEIGSAFLGNEALQHKALMSLERMNLRSMEASLRSWLGDSLIPDWIKKQLLFFMMEQDFNLELQILINEKLHLLNTKDLQSPFSSKSFLLCEHELREKLESDNPSLLILCVSHLEHLALSAFPFSKLEVSSDHIISEVKSFLGEA